MPTTTALSDAYEEILARFGQHLVGPLGEAQTTRNYSTRTRQYLAWLETADLSTVCLGEDGDPLGDEDTATYALRDYRSYLQTVRKASPATQNAHMTAIRSFYGWLGLSPTMPKQQPAGRSEPHGLGKAEEKAVARAAEKLPGRDRLIITVMRLAGLRIGEVVALDVDDVPVSARKGHVIVRSGKGSKHRTVEMLPELRTAVHAYLAERRTQQPVDGHEQALLLSREGKRLSENGVRKVVAKAARLAGLDEHLHPHRLRHTFGTTMARSGVDLVTIADLMGHDSIETTRRYAASRAEDRRAALSVLYSEHEEDE